MDIGLLVAGQLWRLQRGTAYGIREGRVMLDRRDRNPYTGAEFPVPAIVNPRMAAFTLPALSTYPSGDPHLPFQVKPLSSVFMDDLKVAHKYGGDDGA
jgi:hypothetical protein